MAQKIMTDVFYSPPAINKTKTNYSHIYPHTNYRQTHNKQTYPHIQKVKRNQFLDFCGLKFYHYNRFLFLHLENKME